MSIPRFGAEHALARPSRIYRSVARHGREFQLTGRGFPAVAWPSQWSSVGSTQFAEWGQESGLSGLEEETDLYAADAALAESGGAELSEADLSEGDVGESDVGEADLGDVDLGQGDLGEADLGEADLGDAGTATLSTFA